MVAIKNEPVTHNAPTEENVGKVLVQVELFSCSDEDMIRLGHRKAGNVRTANVETLVDTGATLMCLSQEVLDALGIPVFDTRTSRYANGQTAVKKIYGPIHIRVMGRDALVAATATHPGMPSLLGQIPLESLDLLVDPKRHRLIPGHPDYPNEQLIECY